MTEKRNLSDNLFHTTNILVELEGVCTQNNFEEEEIIPFIQQQLEDFINKHWENQSFKELLQRLKEEAKSIEKQNVEGFEGIVEGEGDDAKKSVLKYLLCQIDNKNFTEAFKEVQKEIAVEGYTSGSLKTKISNNVDTVFKSWSETEKKVFIFSSFKINEQKLMLANTEKGDILPVISGHFDEEVGPKNKNETYAKILEKLECTATDLMFISNKVESVAAASASGLVSLLMSTDYTPQGDTGIILVNSISNLEFEASRKKRKMSNESVDVSIPHSVQELKSNISNDSYVEKMDISENGEVKLDEKDLQGCKSGQGDVKECKSVEVVNESNSVELGDGDSKKIDTGEMSVNTDTKINHNTIEATAMETETNDVKHVSIENSKKEESEEKKIIVFEEDMTPNGVQSSSITTDKFVGESEHKTEELKTDKIVENLVKEENISDINALSTQENKCLEEIENNETPISVLTNTEKLTKGDKSASEKKIEEETESKPVSMDVISANTVSDDSVLKQEDKPSKQPEHEVEDKLEINKQVTSLFPEDTGNDVAKPEIEKKEVFEKCTSSENITENMNVDTTKYEPDKSSEDITETSTDNVTAKPVAEEKVDKDSSISKINTTDIDIDCGKSEANKSSEEKTIDKLYLPESELVNTNEDIAKSEDMEITPPIVNKESIRTESDKCSEDKNINISGSVDNNTINLDNTKTEKGEHLEDTNTDMSSYSSESKTENIDMKNPNQEIVDKQCASEVNSQNMIVDTSENEGKSVKDTSGGTGSCSVESNQKTSNDVEKPEIGEKQVDLCLSSEVTILNKDVEAEADNDPSEVKSVDVPQSPTADLVSEDKETELKTDIPSEGNIIDKSCLSSEQNGVNIKNNIEKSDLGLNGTTENGVVENGKHVNGDNDLTDVENLPSSEKKQVVENNSTTGTDIQA